MLARLVTVALVFFAAESIGQSEVKEAKFVRRFEATARLGQWIQSSAFSPDGLRLVSAATDDNVRIWDVESGKEIRRFANKNPVCATFSPDGHLIATGCHDGSIKLWDVNTVAATGSPAEDYRQRASAFAGPGPRGRGPVPSARLPSLLSGRLPLSVWPGGTGAQGRTDPERPPRCQGWNASYQ